MVSEKVKRIEERKVELAEKEKDASGAVRVPMYWKNKSGFHRVGSKFVRQALQQFTLGFRIEKHTHHGPVYILH